MLWRIADHVRLAAGAGARFDEHGPDSFDTFLTPALKPSTPKDWKERGWKGPGTVARLAAALELLAWSGDTASRPPGPIGCAQVEAAVALWTGYFRAHAGVMFRRGGPTDLERQARRVVRWLKAGGRTEVSREDVRRTALAQSVSATGAIWCSPG
jgi:hypothetical protein